MYRSGDEMTSVSRIFRGVTINFKRGQNMGRELKSAVRGDLIKIQNIEKLTGADKMKGSSVVNQQYGGGRTLLHESVYSGSLEGVKY